MAVDPNKIRNTVGSIPAAPVVEEEPTQAPGQLRSTSEFTSQLGAAVPVMINDMALRSTGSSAMGGIAATEEYQDLSTIGGTFKALPSFVDQFWMDDFRSGPIRRGQTFEIDPLSLYTNPLIPGVGTTAMAMKYLGLDVPKVETPEALGTAANFAWSSTAGRLGQGLGMALDALVEGLEWTSGAIGYGYSRTPWYNDEVVERPTWDTAQKLGFGDVWTLGTQTQAGNYSEYVAQAKRDWDAQQRNIENKDALEITGMAVKDAFSGKQPVDIWAAEGFDTALAGAPIFVPEGFDPNDPEQWKQFQAGDQADRFNFTSELAQLAGEWYLGAAPFKAVKWARSGSEMFGFSGITSRNTAIARVNQKMERETDEFLEFLDTSGASGKVTSMGADAEALARGSRAEILKFDWVKPKRGAGGTEAEIIANIGAEITDPKTAAIFRAAMSGSAKYQQRLVDEHGLLADAIMRQRNATVKVGTSEELLWIQKPSGVMINPLVRNNLDGMADNALVADAIRMADELNILDKAGFAVAEAGMQGVRTAGTNTVWGKRIANAWRAGSAHRQENTLINKASGRGTSSPEGGSWGDRVTRMHNEGSAIEEFSFQVSKHFRPVGILNWVNSEKQSGWLVIRGTDNTDSGLEWSAAFSSSKTLVRDQEFTNRMMRLWGRAYTEEQKMRAKDIIERLVVKRLAREYGVDHNKAVDVYRAIYSMRQSTLDTLKRQKGKDVGYGYDPETGKLLLSSPVLASQLESRVPILDFALMEKTIKRMSGKTYGDVFRAKAPGEGVALGRTGHTFNMFLDELNSMWKLNTLLRLGYTQRNLTEGWMRSLAYLGTIPNASMENISRGTGRLFTNTWRAGQRYKIGQQQKAVSEIMDGTRAMVKQLDDDIALLDARIAARPTGVRERDLRRQRAGAIEERRQYQNELDFQQSYMQMLTDKRYKNRHRRMYDEDDAAFGGVHGDLRRITSGADVNVDTFLQGRAARRLISDVGDDGKYKIIDPGEANYFDELVTAGEQFTGDTLARMALNNRGVDEMTEWLMSRKGRVYLQKLGLATDADAARSHASRVHRIVNNYLPTEESRALFRGKVTPTTEELRSSLGSARLSPIHGMEVEAAGGFSVKKAALNASELRGSLFKWLGSKPESLLVRHPFYAEVYARRRAEMIGLAKAQGREWTTDLDEAIEKAAHRSAQKATTDVMFTITRYSNPASLMRYLSPFFSAWENSMRTWGTIVARDPSTLMRGSFLWDTINRYGNVVTYDGQKIESDKWGFLTGENQDAFILLPEAWTAGLAERTGGMIPAIPKGGLNVITPGATPYLPGFGPGAIVPAQLVLANKPDMQNTLHRVLGDKLYQQIAPFGRVKPFSFDQLLSSGQRKAVMGAMGDSNEDWLKTTDAVAKNMLTDWYRAGGDPSTKPTEADFTEASQNWFKFNVLANYTMPFAVTRLSKYRTELAAWRAMSQVMPYEEAMARFEEMYPGSVALTVSATERRSFGIRPDESSFSVISRNEDLIKDKGARVNNQSVSPAGILAAASMKGAFNPAVYDYFTTGKDFYSGDRYSNQLGVAELNDEVNLRSAWLELNRVKAEVDEAIETGAITATEGRAKLKAFALNTEPGGMVDRFGRDWETAYQSFQSTAAVQLGMIAEIAADEKFAASADGDTRTWGLIREYMRIRSETYEAKQLAKSDDEKKMITEAWERWKLQYRNSSLGFSDFFDMFFEGDDLTAKISYKTGE